MKKLAFPVLVIVLLITCSCQQRMYFPDRVNAPGLTHAGDIKATLAAKINGNDNTKDSNFHSSLFSPSFDISYAPTDHFGIFGSYRTVLNRYIHEETDGTFLEDDTIMGGVFNGHRFEIGAGYFTTFGSKGKAELYGGLGMGNIERNGKRFPQFNYNSKYYRYFIQPAIGLNANNNFSLSGGFRLTMQQFYEFTSADPLFKYHILTINDYGAGRDVTKSLYAFLEPFVNMELGYKFIRFNMQVCGTFALSKYGSDISGNTPVAFSMGLTFFYSQKFFDAR